MKNIAVLFPGQGSQKVGMLADFQYEAVVRQCFEQASDVLKMDFWALAQTGPKESLDLTVNTQPVMLVADIALWRMWQSQVAVTPVALAGHSLGEYAALVAAGALSFEDALQLVRVRAELMQSAIAVGEGGMLAVVGMSASTLAEACAALVDETAFLELANFNTEQQIVVAGNRIGLTKLLQYLADFAAVKAILLPTSVPSHCILMQPAAQILQQHLSSTSFSDTMFPVLQNVQPEPTQDCAVIREMLAKQLYQPVQWVSTMQCLGEMEVEVYLECGPGRVLSGLSRKISRDIVCLGLSDRAGFDRALNAVSA